MRCFLASLNEHNSFQSRHISYSYWRLLYIVTVHIKLRCSVVTGYIISTSRETAHIYIIIHRYNIAIMLFESQICYCYMQIYQKKWYANLRRHKVEQCANEIIITHMFWTKKTDERTTSGINVRKWAKSTLWWWVEIFLDVLWISNFQLAGRLVQPIDSLQAPVSCFHALLWCRRLMQIEVLLPYRKFNSAIRIQLMVRFIHH